LRENFHRFLLGVNFINILLTHFCTKVLWEAFFYLHVTREKLPKRLLYKKTLVKCWWNWHLRLISPTCLPEAFTFEDPKSAKRQSRHQCLFVLLGSAQVKADCKMLLKSTPWANPTKLFSSKTYNWPVTKLSRFTM